MSKEEFKHYGLAFPPRLVCMEFFALSVSQIIVLACSQERTHKRIKKRTKRLLMCKVSRVIFLTSSKSVITVNLYELLVKQSKLFYMFLF